NARAFTVFDLLIRVLRRHYGADRVLYARNITDIDDRILERAGERGISIDTLTHETTEGFHGDVAELNLLIPDIEPRATEHLPEMIAMIEALIAKGHAYVAEGNVLFHVPSFPDYGKLSGRSADEMMPGARVEVESYKRDPMDFILW